MANKFSVREKNGRWQKVNNLSSAIATAQHGRSGVEHQVQQLDDLTGEVTTVRISPPAKNVGRPVAGNQIFRGKQ
jgi:hypothetical protein